MNIIHVDKNCFRHNKTHSVFEYEIAVIINEHALFSTTSVDWILDSGTIKHVCCNKTYFDHLKPYNINLKWNSANQISINDIGSIQFALFNNSFSNSFSAIRLKNVLFVFELNINLLFLNKFKKKMDMKSISNQNYVKLEKTPPLSTAFIDKIWFISTLNQNKKNIRFDQFWLLTCLDEAYWSKNF